MSDRIHAFTVDYRKREPNTSHGPFSRGFFVHGLPRLMALCRLRGHRPIVDGVGTLNPDAPGVGYVSRWVCCDRCGIRPDPQGRLNPHQWAVGQPYPGPWAEPSQDGPPSREQLRDLKDAPDYLPGSFPAVPRGEIGGQLVLGPPMSGFNIGVKIGHGGSEHTLAAHVRIWPLGALYLHTEGFGTWLQRRLNPVDMESRVIELSAHNGQLHWQLWAKRDSWTNKDPAWQNGSLRIDPRDLLFGQRRYTYTDHCGPLTGLVRMPHGDDHEVRLQLQAVDHGRPKGRRQVRSWSVGWTTTGEGIPTKPGNQGRVHGSHVTVPDQAVTEGTWTTEATAAIATYMTSARTRYSWSPAPAVV